MKNVFVVFFTLIVIFVFVGFNYKSVKVNSKTEKLKKFFLNPPDSVRPGVYWYIMDGNLSRKAITADLESMKEAGIGNLIFQEINVGIPRGKVDFLSKEWLELFKFAEKEAERLGIKITLGLGPGWAGSGGPWVKPEQSMQHLVSSTHEVKGPAKLSIVLSKPLPRKPYFGEGILTKEIKLIRDAFYEDVAVLAFPTPEGKLSISDIDEKAFYYREPYWTNTGTRQYLPALASFKSTPDNSSIDKESIIDLTSLLRPDGTLDWNVPAGKWTIMRFGRTNNGAITRPAPFPGVGFECDKLDTVAFNVHFKEFIGKLIPDSSSPTGQKKGGLTTLHIDSWEMGSQNWTPNFRKEFQRRRGYDPLLFFPVYAGKVVGSYEKSERFLWDIRLTIQELVIEYHAQHAKNVGKRYGLNLSIEPYAFNPPADLDYGAIADVPMGEFWNKGFGFDGSFSCIEATSIAHVLGKPVVAAESFTSDWGKEGYISYPGSLKNQGDWAFCTGINRFVFHTFVHKSFSDQYRPGMTMGGYGVHWDRGQTWWPMVSAYHKYVSRCSFLLQQGRTVADVLYLTPEGAPFVFRPPPSAMVGNDTIPDRRGYNFDGCSPNMLIANAKVKDHQVVFASGATYRLLVLPAFETMTPELLEKIKSLVKDGAIIVGTPPLKSPSLVNYPECDSIVRSTAGKLWGSLITPATIQEISFGKGKICWGGSLSKHTASELYPHYDATAALLKKMGVAQDFESIGSLRYTHRKLDECDIYFVSNKTNQELSAECIFNIEDGIPEIWDPVTGDACMLSDYRHHKGRTSIPLMFSSYQSYFIVFDKRGKPDSQKVVVANNFPKMHAINNFEGAWDVSFDPKWGGPEKVIFQKLEDWTKRPEKGINFYSGIATYSTTFELSELKHFEYFLSLGEVHCMARVRINGKDLGVVWTAPWQLKITDALKQGTNHLEIDVVNLWVNRLIGDEQFPDDGIKEGKWPEWLLEEKPRTSGRYTFCTNKFYDANSPLQKSGLIGPVKIMEELYK